MIRPAQMKSKAKPKEFWEGDQWRNYFTDPDYQAGQPPPAGWQAPDFDVEQLTEQATAPMWREYEKGVERMGSRLSKRRMGESGAYQAGEHDLLLDFLGEVGAVSSDITMRGAEFELKEYETIQRMEQEWKRLGLTEQEMQNEMYRFEQTLAWEKEKFGEILEWEERQWADELAFRYDELVQRGELTREQMAQDLDIFMRGLAFKREQTWGYTDELGIYHPGTMDVEQQKIDMERMAIFGYWDEGYGPGEENMPEREYDQYGLPSGEYKDYYDRYYHKGSLDLREWESTIDYILGLQGVSNIDTSTDAGKWRQVAEYEERYKKLHGQLSAGVIRNGRDWAYTAEGQALMADMRMLQDQIADLKSQMGGGG